jgi:hypothetical protein
MSTMTAKQMISWLAKFDPDEIVIGQIFTADDLADNELGIPSREVMTTLDYLYWKDGITRETLPWLAELAIEQMGGAGKNA